LDLPEVSLVAILDADKEGYLRSARSLIQTIGRAARNLNGKVIMYADQMTGSMRQAIGETDRRRARQLAYNEEHGITPKSIVKAIDASLVEMYSPEWAVVPEVGAPGKAEDDDGALSPHELSDRITGLRREMMDAAQQLEYERAAELRDRIKRLERRVFGLDKPPAPPAAPAGSAHSGAGRHRGADGAAVGALSADKPTLAAGANDVESGGKGSRGAARGRGRGAIAKPAPKQGRLKLVPDRRD
jgi:excinuclease ABC subunit B